MHISGVFQVIKTSEHFRLVYRYKTMAKRKQFRQENKTLNRRKQDSFPNNIR